MTKADAIVRNDEVVGSSPTSSTKFSSVSGCSRPPFRDFVDLRRPPLLDQNPLQEREVAWYPLGFQGVSRLGTPGGQSLILSETPCTILLNWPLLHRKFLYPGKFYTLLLDAGMLL
jgi:hypothetical protein